NSPNNDGAPSPDETANGRGSKGRSKKKQGGKKRQGNPTGEAGENEQPPKKKGVLFKSTKQTPAGHVLRTYRLRFYPTPDQRRMLKEWFAGARSTYNWALSVLKNHYRRGLRLIDPSNRMALKTQFVTCHVSRIPKNRRWLKNVPYLIKEEATKELSMAYAAAFSRLADGSAKVFDHIKFRSAKVLVQQRSPSQQPTSVNALATDGPPRAVKLTKTKTGRFFMHVPLYVRKEQVRPEATGHLVTLDPGSNPYMTYYSPTAMLTGSFGTTLDLNNTFRPYQNRLDALNSLLGKAWAGSEDAPYLPPNVRNKVKIRVLRIYEKIHDRTTESINKIVRYLTLEYQYVHGSIFEVENMVKRPTYTVVEGGKTRRGKGRLRARTRRDLLMWRHGGFKRALAGKAELIEGLIVELNDEAYTTQTTSLVPVNGGSLQSQRPGEIEQLDTITTDLKRSSAMASGIMESEAASAGQMKLLLDHAKKIVVQLRGMVDYDVDLRDDDGSLPPYDKLVGRLTHAFRHQAEINQMNAKLLSFSYVANLSNYAKNRQLQKAIARGRRQIMELQNTVTSLEGSVDTLTVEVDVQRKTAERLKVALDNTRGLLETTMVEYRQELSRQREVLRKQSTVMERLWQSKFNQDFVLDSM
ncbi:hypothetical protein HK104_003512, partial [Borealophlyctis nickersoniae]